MADLYEHAIVSPELPASLFSNDELESLCSACDLHYFEHDGLLDFYASYFASEGEDHNGCTVNCIDIFQAKLKQLDETAYPAIVIEGAFTSNKMRSKYFGGFAFFITRTEVRDTTTSNWIDNLKAALNQGLPA